MQQLENGTECPRKIRHRTPFLALSSSQRTNWHWILAIPANHSDLGSTGELGMKYRRNAAKFTCRLRQSEQRLILCEAGQLQLRFEIGSDTLIICRPGKLLVSTM